MSTPDPSERRRQFRALHQGGCFLLPNPWDIGSARYLQSAGFKALASTSSGHAWSQGKADGAEEKGSGSFSFTQEINLTLFWSPFGLPGYLFA